ncbi:MAG: hypothetical protein Q8L98_07790 [Chlamydiales bacterium]|nr:hypothetical protein [Chlamydiales bacterium]
MSAISLSQNFFSLLKSRELGARVPLFTGQNLLIQNIQEGNYTKTLFNGVGLQIKAFDVKDDFIVTASDVIKLWNLKTGQCLWTFAPTPKVYWGKTIKIVEGHIVCSGFVKATRQPYNGTIRIIDVKTGVEKFAITNRLLEIDKVCAIGGRIFCVFGQVIGEWDFEGNFIRRRTSEKLDGQKAQFLGLGKFLVFAYNNRIIMRDIQKNTVRKFELDTEQGKPKISSAHIEGHQLICGFNSDETKNSSHCCVIDLERRSITDQYEVIGAFVDDETSEFGQIVTVLKKEEWVYLGYTTGAVVAVNLIEKKHVVLGKHPSCVSHLVIDGFVLISGSSKSENTSSSGELKFWDIRSMKEIATKNFSNLIKISFVAGKVFTATDYSLEQFDYLVAHKGEEIAKK